MALVKPAHMLFTDREEPREAFWKTLRRLEEEPQSHQVITFYGEGGIGKTWLLNELKRNIDRMETEKRYSFDDGFVFRGKYTAVLYDLETSTDMIEVLCHLRYRLQAAQKDLAFPIFDVAVKKYKEITGLTLSVAENDKGSALSKYEEMLDTASLFIPGFGLLSDLYEKVKKGGEILSGILDKIEDKKHRETYREYYEAISYSETAEDLRRNMVEFFKTDLNNSERDYGIVFLIDTFELLQNSFAAGSWLSEELKDARNTCWVIAGRNKVYSEEANEHLLGDLSYKDSAEYLRKEGIEDQEIVDKIYDAAGGPPIYLYLSVVNYRKEGMPSAEQFRNLNKQDLLERYVRGLNSEEKTVIRLMSSMSHWTDRDYREVFEEVYQNYLPYSEAYHSLVATTMISKDNQDRYFLHRAARLGIYEDKNYPEEARSASVSAILGVYLERVKKKEDLHYYSDRVSELLESCAQSRITLKPDDHMLIHDILRSLTRSLYSYGITEIRRLAETTERCEEKLCRANKEKALWEDVLGEMKRTCGEYEAAIQHLDKAVECYRESYPEDDRSYLVCLNERALAYSDAGYRKKALALKEEIYEIEKKVYGPDHPEALTALGNLGLEYSNCGMNEKAIATLKEVIEKRKKIMKEDDPRILSNLHNLAITYGNMNDLAKSTPIYEEVVEKRKRVLGPKHPLTLLTSRLLASNYQRSGKSEEALTMMQSIYEQQKEVLGGSNPDTIGTLNNIGRIYYRLKQYNKAKEIHQQAYDRALVAQGENSDQFLSIANNLSLDHSALKEYDKAHDLLQQVYRKRSKIQDKYDPSLITNLFNLAYLEISMGDLSSAEEKMLDYCERCKAVFGAESDGVAKALSELSDLYFRTKEFGKELPVEEELYRIRSKKLGETHPDTLNVLHDLANTYSNLKEYDRAIELNERAYTQRRDTLGEENKSTQATKKNLKTAYRSALNAETELDKKKALLEKEEVFFGDTDWDVLDARLTLSSSVFRTGDPAVSLEMDRQIYEKCTRVFGEDDPLSMLALNNLAYRYSKTDQPDVYLDMSRKAYEKRREVLGPEHPDTLLSLSNVSYACEKNGLFEEALSIRREVLEKRRKLFGNGDRRTVLAVYSLAEILYKMGEYQEALKYYEELEAGYLRIYGENDGNTRYARRRLKEVREILQK